MYMGICLYIIALLQRYYLLPLDSRSIFKWHKEPLQEYVPFDPSTPDQSANARYPKTYLGSYDPEGGMTFRALNYLQTQIFIDGRNRKGKQALQHMDEVAEKLERSFGEKVNNAALPVKSLQ